MFYPTFKEATYKCLVVKRGNNFVPDLPDLPFGLVLCFVDGVNYYGYPLPAKTEGKDCIAHVVYPAKDDEEMQKFAGKIGIGNEVCLTAAYKSVQKTTVADVKIAEEKAILIAEAEKLGQVVSQATLDAVKYDIKDHPDAEDGAPLWVFHKKEYIDK